MPTHVTSRTWMPNDLERLKQMVETNVSAVRAAVAFKRSVVAVKIKGEGAGLSIPG